MKTRGLRACASIEESARPGGTGPMKQIHVRTRRFSFPLPPGFASCTQPCRVFESYRRSQKNRPSKSITYRRPHSTLELTRSGIEPASGPHLVTKLQTSRNFRLCLDVTLITPTFVEGSSGKLTFSRDYRQNGDDCEN